MSTGNKNRINLGRNAYIDERRNLSSLDTEILDKMASDPVDSIFKALRLVPEFDGNPHILTRFINLCDQLVITHFKTEPGHDFINLSLLNGILNKVTGPAARLINSNGIPENWLGIRNTLINNFADHRDETALYNDLSLQTQGSSSPQEFYERCQSLFSTIMTYISLHETVPTTIEAKRTLYQKLTLQCYLRGLKEPLGSRIRCMRPDSMEKALSFVQEELNTLYLQQRNDNLPKRAWHPQPSVPINTFNLPLNNFTMTRPVGNLNMPIQQQNTYPKNHLGWKPNQIIPQYRGPSRTQQIFRAPPTNYNPHDNVFKVPPRPQVPPTIRNNFSQPMSGVSHYTSRPMPPSGHDWRKFGNPPPNNYFKTREVNFNDFDFDYGCDNPDYDYEYYTEYYDYQPQPNFYPVNYEQPIYTENVTVEEVNQEPAPENSGNFQKVTKSEKPK